MRIKPVVVLLLLVLSGGLGVRAQTIKKRKIKKLISRSAVLNDHFMGFALYDMDNRQMVYELNADKYFIPASNAKLLTFYTCLKMLGDSIPGLQYVTHGDSLICWGAGDPSLLHRTLTGNATVSFLSKTNKQLYFDTGRYQNSFYGTGWAWDDYNEYYQPEINEWPLYGNTVRFRAGNDGKLEVSPRYFSDHLKCDSSYHPALFTIKRDWTGNTFIYPPIPVPIGFEQEIPWKTSTALTLRLLQDTLKRPIGELNAPMPADAKTIYNAKADSVYQLMLQTSDNFIAEQLLLVCSASQFGVLNTDSIINYSLKTYLANLPDKPRWVDGSGLSRYNLITPRDMVSLLVQLPELKDEQILRNMLPAGGISGTLKDVYQTDNGQPFIWAKTGSVSNNYNQSGYLVTRKGKRLAFSFMNNNFNQPTAPVRAEIARIMTYIHENF
jgi:D-alanyl-D-alanine carboxypeptidase/D-alanyl-D-alanine-endopeptidase (penicillin-binding protein 4)